MGLTQIQFNFYENMPLKEEELDALKGYLKNRDAGSNRLKMLIVNKFFYDKFLQQYPDKKNPIDLEKIKQMPIEIFCAYNEAADLQ